MPFVVLEVSDRFDFRSIDTPEVHQLCYSASLPSALVGLQLDRADAQAAALELLPKRKTHRARHTMAAVLPFRRLSAVEALSEDRGEGEVWDMDDVLDLPDAGMVDGRLVPEREPAERAS